ncbi:hypothetical protein [Brevibacillus laterosporus]|uniref:hypothetical protein n=1 Tax=Brevibacillus laterosporus TaxID=1465 RepID=UPI000CE555B7|nr:hypothetical protein [Brevibacillus laterosporus]MED1666047.1 hypothetical protein [Brevibacillus laterosporus]MED1667828.1 hypothetical protein [Brevibacillus laterosporus]MED1719617.1 hypothetical protein [Brevibacillus laterosporus]PPA89972.1 hypothetical protein C4A76_00395 [Brevibacillus laterosporus]
MSWIEGDSTIQLLPQDLEKMFNEHGWDTFATYRAVSPSVRQFADVRLFKSKGSDNQIRNFGMVYGYGETKKVSLGEQDFISQNSILGQLTLKEGTEKSYQIKVYPVAKDTAIVYKNGLPLDDTDFTIELFTGVLTLKDKPEATDVITISYSPDPTAPLPVKRLYFFTFDDVRGEKIVQGVNGTVVIGDPESILPDGDGTRKEFLIPTTSDIKEGSVRLYVNGIEVEADLYTVDYEGHKITFKPTSKAPDVGAELHTSYIKILNHTGTGTLNYGDIKVKKFDPDKATELLDAAYSAIYYIYPSLPTAMSFTPLQNFDRGWQRDSTMYYWGNITKDRIVMFFRPDPSANAKDTYIAPLYIGKLTTVGKSPRKNNVIISGCRKEDEIIWKKDMKLGAVFVDYGSGTSNGNSSVQLQQSIGGTYYQKHYFAFITHDKMVDAGESRFNPSVYNGKYYISPMYIVHPNDGYVGKLDECYAIHPKNISQMDNLEVSETSENEDLGKGDGVNKVFHLSRQPSLKDEGIPYKLEVKVACTEMVYGVDYTLEMDTKAITFKEGKVPAKGAEVIATYDFKQSYRYTMADTPNSPFTLANISPYAPIGLGILRENLLKNS